MVDGVPKSASWVLPLTPRELEFSILYAQGRTLKYIALATHATLGNVGHMLHRAKVKYRHAGYDVHTKADLQERLRIDGLLP